MQHARQMSASSSASSFTVPAAREDEGESAVLLGTTPTLRNGNGVLDSAHTPAQMQRAWSGESLAPQLPDYDENRPRKHHRRTSLPLQSAAGGPATIQPDAAVAAAKAERKRFRDALKLSKRRGVQALTPATTATGDSGSATASGGRSATRGRPRSDTLEEERERGTTTDASSAHEVTTPSFYSSTTYAAGPSGRNAEENATSSDEPSSSDRQTFEWDVRRADTLAIARHRQHRSSFDDRTSSVRARRMRLAGESRAPPPPSSSAARRDSSSIRDSRAPPRRGSVDANAPAASSSALSRLQIPSLRQAALGLASPTARSKDATPPYGTPPSTEVGQGSASRRAQAKIKKRLRVNPAAEAVLILGAGALACYELARSDETVVRDRVLELSWVLGASALYVVTRRRGDQGYIWTTDSRSFRQAGDDGALNALLFGPLLAASSVLATARQEASLSRAPLIAQSWLVEGPLPILSPQTGRPSATRSVLLGQCSLLSIQTLTSTILLCHLLASKLLRRPQDHAPISSWHRLRNFVACELVVALLMECAREAAAHFGAPLWTDLARWELFTIALVYQNNLYSISRLARRSFTLGELGLVAGVGATLIMEALNVTLAKIFPVITPYVKTYRLATPLVIFQLALIVGAFMAGFLLSPLLYLSRHLAQKPVHRLRWPHKRDMHRRLLAGFFYLFTALFVVGVLGLWVRWLLVRRDPWIWTMRFLVSGQTWWARPALIVYWLALVSASVLSWQAIVVSAKRFRVVRTPGAGGIASSKIVVVQPPLIGSEAAARQEGSDPGAPSAGNKRASASMVVRQLSGLGSAAGAAAAATETGGVTLKKAAHLSLNARRKFFHALAVLLFVPGIALDPAFSHLAFSLAFSAFIFAEYIRYYALYPFGASLHVFMAEFTDHKDAGPVILSHFYLLTGCASALWLEGPSQITQQMGVLVLGVGDALASVVGRRYGKVFWPGSNKTMEGSAAFVGSILASAWALRLVGWVGDFSLPRFSVVLLLLGLLEGVSEQNDNLVLPLYSYIAMTLLDV